MLLYHQCLFGTWGERRGDLCWKFWRGAQCQWSDLRWTKMKQAQASHETKNPWFFRQFYYRFHWLEVTKPDDSPYTRKNLSLLADFLKQFSIFKSKIINFRLKMLKLLTLTSSFLEYNYPRALMGYLGNRKKLIIQIHEIHLRPKMSILNQIASTVPQFRRPWC